MIFIISAGFNISHKLNNLTEVIPVSGGTYREGMIGQPVFINPVIAKNQIDLDISSLIYPKLEVLLENLEASDNGRSYLLTLKQGLIWTNEEKLTSDDVIYTINLIQDPQLHSPFFENWQGVIAQRNSEIQIKLILSSPYAFFDKQIKNLFIIPKFIFGHLPPENLRLSDYNLKPIGAGPYIFKSLSKRKDGFITEYRLSLNKKYAGDKPFIKNFYFKFYENKNDLLKDFKWRQIDGFGSLEPLEIFSQQMKKTQTFLLPMPRYYAIFLNNLHPLLSQKLFREALNKAIDKEKIVSEIFQNQAQKINGPFIDLKDESSTNDFDPAAAKEILAHFNLSSELNLVVPKIDFLLKTAAMVKNNWEAVGLKINLIELEPSDVFNQVIKSRQYEMILFGNVLNNSEDLFPFWHSSERFYPGLNLSLYSNSQLDTLLENLRQNQENKTRLEQMKQIKDLIEKETPAIFLFSLPYFYIQNKEVKGQHFSQISWPFERFSDISHWYFKTARVFK